MFQLLSVDGATGFFLFMSLVSTILAIVIIVQFFSLVSNVKEINFKCMMILDELTRIRKKEGQKEKEKQEKEAGN